MRHNKKINHLSRTTAHRKAMLANMASSLIESKRIATTVAKAKALRRYVEPLITKAKNDTTHSRRMVFSYLQNKEAVSELFRDVAVKVGDRPGGYTRILRTGNRLGDNAEMCIIELVDYNEAMLASLEEAAKPKRRRSRRGGSGSGSSKKTETPKSEATEGKKTEEKSGAETAMEDAPEMEETGNDSPAEEKKASAETSGNEDVQAPEDVNSEGEGNAEQDKDVDEKKEE